MNMLPNFGYRQFRLVGRVRVWQLTLLLLFLWIFVLSDDMVSQGVSTGDGLAAVGAEVARVIHMSTQSYIYTHKQSWGSGWSRVGPGSDPGIKTGSLNPDAQTEFGTDLSKILIRLRPFIIPLIRLVLGTRNTRVSLMSRSTFYEEVVFWFVKGVRDRIEKFCNSSYSSGWTLIITIIKKSS